MRQYVVDCESLRKRYNIEAAAGPSAAPAEQPAVIINCKAEVERFWRNRCDTATTEHHQSPEESPEEPAGEPAGEQMGEDEESVNDIEHEEPGRSMHERGEVPQSPDSENHGICHGYTQAARTASATVLPDHLTAQLTPGFRRVISDTPLLGR